MHRKCAKIRQLDLFSSLAHRLRPYLGDEAGSDHPLEEIPDQLGVNTDKCGSWLLALVEVHQSILR